MKQLSLCENELLFCPFLKLFFCFFSFRLFVILAQSSFKSEESKDSPFVVHQPTKLFWHGHENMYKSCTNQPVNQHTEMTASNKTHKLAYREKRELGFALTEGGVWILPSTVPSKR